MTVATASAGGVAYGGRVYLQMSMRAAIELRRTIVA